jgi:hypothetical protein
MSFGHSEEWIFWATNIMSYEYSNICIFWAIDNLILGCWPLAGLSPEMVLKVNFEIFLEH